MSMVVPAAVVFTGMCGCAGLVSENVQVPAGLGKGIAIGMVQAGEPIEAVVAELTRVAVAIRDGRMGAWREPGR